MAVRKEGKEVEPSLGGGGARAGGFCDGGPGQGSWVGGVERGQSGHRQLPKLASDG